MRKFDFRQQHASWTIFALTSTIEVVVTYGDMICNLGAWSDAGTLGSQRRRRWAWSIACATCPSMAQHVRFECFV
eukprot:6484762-Amphidinium_carterae.1